MHLLTLAAAALAALLLTVALASAQEPPESQTATHLEPGLNLVGWVGESASVSQLFREIPQLESIWAWDAELDDWIVAGRGAPEWLGGLGWVTAGMGLRLVLGGEESFLWERSTQPTRGLVKLRTGWNLVAWSGADGAPIEQVAKGIGWSLRELRRWNAANQQWTTWTSPERSAQLIATSATDQTATGEEAEHTTVRRGEALWVNAARSVNWLQPTDILPRLVFPGGASDELQARVREDLESVLTFYGQQYGIQADLDFTIYVAKDVDALIQAYRDDGDEIDDAEAASIRARWDRSGGWLGRGIVVKQASWPEDLSTNDISWARYTLTHEYFHILQGQLSDRRASQWLVEGTATWAGDDHQAVDGSGTWEDARERRMSVVTESTPSLRSTESENAGWHYALGWLAVDRLTAAAGGGSYIEFWRRLASAKIDPYGQIDPYGRRTPPPDWRTAFQETFGIPASSFYADFNAWQQEQAAANEPTANLGDDDARWIRGRVTDSDGTPASGVFVNAIRVEGETSVGWNQRGETGVDGTFAVRAPEDGDYRISVDISDDCTRYYSNGGLTEEPDEAQPITVAGSDMQDVSIPLPANICGWQIHGQVVSAAGEPLAGVPVHACRPIGGICMWSWGDRTTLDGSFAVTVPVGAYRLTFGLNGCSIFYHAGGLTARYADASLVKVTEAESPSLQLRVPEGMCAHRISGRFVDANGAPLVDKYIDVCSTYDCGLVRTTTDGRFTIRVPSDDSYTFDVRLASGCDHRLEGRALGSSDNPVRVSGADVTNIVLRLPGTIEELCG